MNTRTAVRCAMATLAGSVLSLPVYAQIDEIVVTATKREQTLQDVPVAVSVVQPEVIAQAQIIDILDLQSIVPSLRVTQLQTSTQTNFLIRGFGNGANNPGIEPAVGVFIDGVYRSRSASQIGDLLDIERIEVVKGSQSTLFGKNASVGVINIVTQRPAREFGGHAEASIGNYNQRILQGRVTGPLGETTAFSLTGSLNKRDGYFRNLFNGQDLNERDRWSLRGQVLWEPSDTQSWRLIGDFSRIEEDCCGVSNLVDGPTGAAVRAVGGEIFPEDPFARRAFLDVQPENKVDNGGLSLQGDFDLGALTLTSITAFRTQEAQFDYDTDFTSADLVPTNESIQDIDTYTQEFRLAYFGDGPITWQVGGLFMREEVEYINGIQLGSAFRPYASLLAGNPAAFDGLEAALGLPSGILFGEGQGNRAVFEQDNNFFSVFGQMDWALTDRATLTLGAAYLNDRKKVSATDNHTDVFSQLNFVDIGFAVTLDGLLQAGLPLEVAGPIADQGSVTPCGPNGAAPQPPNCNPFLGLYPLQFIIPLDGFQNERTSDSRLNYNIRLAYEVSNNLNVYAAWATGYKATSWNLSLDTRPFGGPGSSPLGGFDNPFYPRFGTRFAEPERVEVLELGLKGQWADIAVNAALFEQVVKDFQSNIFVGTGFVLANAGKQTTRGLELDVQYRPIPALELAVSGTFLDPKFNSFPGATGVDGPVDLSGERPSGIHRTSVSTAATFYWQAGQLDGFVRADYLYENNVRLVSNVPEEVGSRQVNQLNASVGLSLEDWDVVLWGRNLTNNDFLISAFPSVAQSGSFSGYPNQPRTWGITLRRTF